MENAELRERLFQKESGRPQVLAAILIRFSVISMQDTVVLCKVK